jgi:hypothetical protein
MIFLCLLTAALLPGACGVGEVVFQNLPSIVKCGETIQLNWTYAANASSVFLSSELTITAHATSVYISMQVVSPRLLYYPATSAVVRFTAPRILTPVDLFLGLYGERLNVGRERTGSTQPDAFKTQFACCPECCLPAPNECGHVNETFRCAGRLCVPAWCPTPSAALGLFGCPCSTNTTYLRCAGVYACDSPLEQALCIAPPPIRADTRCTFSSIDSCSQRNSSYTCAGVPGGPYCRACTHGVTRNCRCDDQRACNTTLCVDGRCGSLGCLGCPCGRWRTCADDLVCNDMQLCESGPANATELCKTTSETAARQCDYATQQNDIDDLLGSAPLDEGLPVQLSPSVAPMCAKLRQLLICRARVFGSSNSDCVDGGIGVTVARLCDAIPAARLAALSCGLCEPEPCDSAMPACLRGLACIGGKCIIDPQYAICRNASSLVGPACPDKAKFEDKETVQLAAKVGAMTNVTDTACATLLVAHTSRSACYARVYADAGCMLPQAGPRHSLCTNDDMAKRIAAIGCSICASSPTITFAPSGTNGPVSSVSLVPSDINAGCLRAPFLGLALVVSAVGFM